jgi:hypothetical protein
MGESTIRRIHALPENFEIRCPRLAKNASAIQHLLHHSIVEHIYTPYRTIKMVAFIIAFLRSWCEFFSEFLLLSELLQFFLSCMGKYFPGTQKISGTNGAVVRYFFHPCDSVLNAKSVHSNISYKSFKT